MLAEILGRLKTENPFFERNDYLLGCDGCKIINLLKVVQPYTYTVQMVTYLVPG